MVTARGSVLGRRPNGTVRKYGLTSSDKTIHIMANGGNQTLCAQSIPKGRQIEPDITNARKIEFFDHPSYKLYGMCLICWGIDTPRPDPAIWRHHP